MLNGKTCVVTAGTGGIGKGIAKQFLEQGAFVFISGRSTTTVDATVSEFKQLGLDNFHGIVANVATVDGCAAFFQEVEATGREVDILVNNMGVFDSGNFFQYSDEQWTEYFNTNIMSTVRFCRHYMAPMLVRNRGRVIIVSSECGLRPIGKMTINTDKLYDIF